MHAEMSIKLAKTGRLTGKKQAGASPLRFPAAQIMGDTVNKITANQFGLDLQ
jgi:hypothetical protein